MQFPTLVWYLNFKFKILVFNLLFIFLRQTVKMLLEYLTATTVSQIELEEKLESLDLVRNYAMRKWPQINS